MLPKIIKNLLTCPDFIDILFESCQQEGMKGCEGCGGTSFLSTLSTIKDCVEQLSCAYQEMDMTVFMEKSGVWEGNNRLCGGASLPIQPRSITFGQGISQHLQFIRASRHGSVSEQDRIADERNVHSAITLFSNLIKRGGDSRKKSRK